MSFEEAAPGAPALIDAAYHAKYDSYGEQMVGTVVGPEAHGATLRLVPDGAATAVGTD